MSDNERPYNTVITTIIDTFKDGEPAIQKTIDLTEVSESELTDLSNTYPEAFLELLWRQLHNSDDE